MIAFYIILAASPALLLTTLVLLVLIVIGIRRRDRGDLASPPQGRIDAITRRMTGLGVRSSAGNEEGEI
jgi:hypothetical protein